MAVDGRARARDARRRRSSRSPRPAALLAALSLATPQAWFLRGIENLTGGAGAGAVLGPAVAILAFAAVTGALAFMRAGRLVAR